MQVFDDLFQAESGWNCRMYGRKLLMMAEKMPEIYRVLQQNKFGKWVLLFGYLK